MREADGPRLAQLQGPAHPRSGAAEVARGARDRGRRRAGDRDRPRRLGLALGGEAGPPCPAGARCHGRRRLARTHGTWAKAHELARRVLLGGSEPSSAMAAGAGVRAAGVCGAAAAAACLAGGVVGPGVSGVGDDWGWAAGMRRRRRCGSLNRRPPRRSRLSLLSRALRAKPKAVGRAQAETGGTPGQNEGGAGAAVEANEPQSAEEQVSNRSLARSGPAGSAAPEASAKAPSSKTPPAGGEFSESPASSPGGGGRSAETEFGAFR